MELCILGPSGTHRKRRSNQAPIFTSKNMPCTALGELRVGPERAHHRGNIFFLFFLWYLYEMTDVSCIYCGDHLTVYVNQTITLFSLIYTVTCQLRVNRNGKNMLRNHIFNVHHEIWYAICGLKLANLVSGDSSFMCEPYEVERIHKKCLRSSLKITY